ncbi:MAG: hypothetical protein M1821_002221 [Bathelium mastoideum]|nr:MAG: hypothetical protein M1821_002221 [Bathelium mastoideum]
MASSDLSSARFETVASSSDVATMGYLAYSFDYADLNSPIPWSAYSGQSSCYCVYGTPTPSASLECPCSTIVDTNYRPALVVPPEVRTLDPAWAHCAIPFGGFYDPPQALTAQSVAAAPQPVSTFTQLTADPAAPVSRTAEPAAAITGPGVQITSTPRPKLPPQEQPSAEEDSSALPNETPETNPGRAGFSANGGGELKPTLTYEDNRPPEPQETHHSVNEAPQGHASIGVLPGALSSNGIWNVLSAALGGHGASGDPVSSPFEAEIVTGIPGAISGMLNGAESSDPKVQEQGHDNSGVSPGGSGAVKDPSDPNASRNRAKSSTLASTVPEQGGPSHSQQATELDKGPGDVGINADGTYDLIATVVGLSIAENTRDQNVVIVDGMRITAGVPETMIGSMHISLGSHGLVIKGSDDEDATTIAMTSAVAGLKATSAALEFAGSEFIPNSRGGYVLAPGMTLTAGGVATFSGTTLSLASDDGFVVIGSSTQLLGLPIVLPASTPLTVGGASFTAYENGEYALAPGNVLTPGGVATFHGTHVSLASDGAFALVDSSTAVLGPVRTPSVLTVGSHTFTANSAGDYNVAPGETLTAGGDVTVDGTVVRLADDGMYAVVAASTEILESSTRNETVSMTSKADAMTSGDGVGGTDVQTATGKGPQAIIHTSRAVERTNMGMWLFWAMVAGIVIAMAVL